MCTRCVMDTSDPEITFDLQGVCSHCIEFDAVTRKSWFPNEEGARRLEAILGSIREAGRGREYDCILGLSGGVDSSYLALKAHEWGLRPLVVHVDAGWNSELAVANIEKVIKYCKFDLHTHVVDWEEVRDLQLAYLKAGIANQDVPQDHVFFASLYQFATKNGIHHVLSGGNIATEGVFPKAWHWSAMDAINLLAIHRQYGSRPLRTYTTVSFFQYVFWYPFVKNMRAVRLLNYIPYDRKLAIRELEQRMGWRSYGRKHGESLFTRFFQNHYLPVKFGYDKRRPQLSSLILSGQMTREEALKALEEPLYDPRELEVDMMYLCKKLRISRAQFDEFMAAPSRHYDEFASWNGRYRVLTGVRQIVERLLGRRVKVYT